MLKLVPRRSTTPKLPPPVSTLRLVPRRKSILLIFVQVRAVERLCVDHSYLDSAAFVKAKINNAGILALGRRSTRKYMTHILMSPVPGYTQALRPGVKGSFGLAIDTQKLNDVSPTGPAHKVCRYTTLQLVPFTDLPLPQVGASFTFEA